MTCEYCKAPIDNVETAAYKELALRPLVYGLCAYMFTKIPLHNRLSFLGFSSPTRAVVSAAALAGAVEGLLGFRLAALDERVPPIGRPIITTLSALVALPIATAIVQRSLSWGILKDIPMIGVGSVLTFPVVGACVSAAHYLWTNPKLALRESKSDDSPVKECYTCNTKWDANGLAALKLFVYAVASSVVLPFVLRRAIPSVPGKIWMAGTLFSPLAVVERMNHTLQGKHLEETQSPGAYLNLLGVTLSTLSVYLMTRKWGPRLDLIGAMGVGLLGYVGARAIDWTITGAINNAYSAWPHPPSSDDEGEVSSYGGGHWGGTDPQRGGGPISTLRSFWA